MRLPSSITLTPRSGVCISLVTPASPIRRMRPQRFLVKQSMTNLPS
jgi:hypothetical protein